MLLAGWCARTARTRSLPRVPARWRRLPPASAFRGTASPMNSTDSPASGKNPSGHCAT